MAQRTLYNVLMVHPQADIEIIATVYRLLAKRYHPDRNPSTRSAARMAEINEAYAILREPAKRASYDKQIGVKLTRVPVARSGSVTANRDRPVSSRGAAFGEAGPPPPFPLARGTILTFGRYKGWSISQVEYSDRDYLEWLRRTPAGRTYHQELHSVLGTAV